ncbi:MAG TPA: hypothetical protein VFO18_18505 [Methylomirabilota bacterium]|nr:hypothetical protein [Methylomirabilota bacterium]
MIRFRLPRWILALLLLVSALAASRAAAAADRWQGLQSMPNVSVEITFSPNHPDVSADEVRPRILEAIKRATPAPIIDIGSADRLHVLIAVRSYSSSDLRGYYLPLSQAYGIGPIRLTVERPAAISGLPAPVWATVWQAERLAKGPWRSSAYEVLELVDEVVASFLADYRRALGQ